MRILTLIIGCAVMCLSSCATSPANDVKPVTDLEVLRLGVQQLTRERQPQGSVTRVEDAATGDQLFGLSIALEDTVWLLNDDHRRTREFVDRASRRIELSRLPTCSWWQWRCIRERNRIQRQIDAAPLKP